jgi:hypothetical protein
VLKNAPFFFFIRKRNFPGDKRKERENNFHVFLQSIDNKKTRQHRTTIKHQQLAIIPTHRVKPDPTVIYQRIKTDLLCNPTRYDPTNKHCSPSPASTSALMSSSTAGERANHCPFPPWENPRNTTRVMYTSSGTQAIKPHHLVSIGDAPCILLPRGPTRQPGPGFNNVSVFFKSGHRSGPVLHFENHLDPTRK